MQGNNNNLVKKYENLYFSSLSLKAGINGLYHNREIGQLIELVFLDKSSNKFFNLNFKTASNLLKETTKTIAIGDMEKVTNMLSLNKSFLELSKSLMSFLIAEGVQINDRTGLWDPNVDEIKGLELAIEEAENLHLFN